MKRECDHPCRQTCTGWHHGYDTGLSITLKRQHAINMMVEAIKYSLDEIRLDQNTEQLNKWKKVLQDAIESWREANEPN